MPDWHARYLQQAGWTRALRGYLFKQTNLAQAARLLEVGCGTGAVLMEVPAGPRAFGLDIDLGALAQAAGHAPHACLTRGDALHLPYLGGSFDITCCHFLLLWVADPLAALAEMRRVTRPGGFVLALAEPDHTRRRDAPEALAALGARQTAALERQGADVGMGARLAALFPAAGISLIETGQLQQGSAAGSDEDGELEWQVLASDLAGSLPAGELEQFRQLDRQARRQGERILHIPTHFAWGRAG